MIPSYRSDLTACGIKQYLSETISAGPSGPFLRVTDVVEVTRAFHPTFTTSCRAYVYLIDIPVSGFWSMKQNLAQKVYYLNSLLQQLEGKNLDYFGLSYGRPQTQDYICNLHHARASIVAFSKNSLCNSCIATERDDATNESAVNSVCIELVGNRFLRRMVRLLVQTSMELVAQSWHFQNTMHINHAVDTDDCHFKASGLDSDALLKLVLKRDRSLAPRTAPPNGLMFIGARLMDT